MIVRIALIAFCLVWFCNFIILSKVYDVSDYEQFKAFWRWRGIIYDGMFFIMSLVFFLLMGLLLRLNMILERALACFMTIITAGSFIDKAFFKIADYMISDIVLIVLGIITSVIIYGKDRRRIKKFID